MDGRYVPNYAMSLNDMRYISRVTYKPLDVHLMIEHPNNTVDLFINNLRKGDTIYIHPEAEYHPSTTIVDKVLVMSVNPGNAGQMFLPYVGEKIETLLKLRERMHFKLYWDGACALDKIAKYAPMGMDGFVLGTTLLFDRGRPYNEIIKEIRDMFE